MGCFLRWIQGPCGTKVRRPSLGGTDRPSPIPYLRIKGQHIHIILRLKTRCQGLGDPSQTPVSDVWRGNFRPRKIDSETLFLVNCVHKVFANAEVLLKFGKIKVCKKISTLRLTFTISNVVFKLTIFPFCARGSDGPRSSFVWQTQGLSTARSSCEPWFPWSQDSVQGSVDLVDPGPCVVGLGLTTWCSID